MRRGPTRAALPVVALLLVVGIVVAAVVASVAVYAFFAPSNACGAFACPTGYSYRSVNNSTLASFSVPPAGVTVDRAFGSVTVGRAGVVLPIETVGDAMAGGHDGFRLFGLIDPTVSIPRGMSVTLLVVNLDDIAHGLALSTTGPPFGEYPMMGSGGMMRGGGMMMVPMFGAYGGGTTYSAASVGLTFVTAGTFWYLCPAPGHASDGMYGSLHIGA